MSIFKSCSSLLSKCSHLCLLRLSCRRTAGSTFRVSFQVGGLINSSSVLYQSDSRSSRAYKWPFKFASVLYCHQFYSPRASVTRSTPAFSVVLPRLISLVLIALSSHLFTESSEPGRGKKMLNSSLPATERPPPLQPRPSAAMLPRA